MIFFIFSCRVPRLGWRHLQWNRRSPYRTCSLPGCCTFRSQPYWRWWWWNWQTCLTQTSECSDRPKPSHVHSSAKWPLVQGHPRYCRSSSKPMREKGRDRWSDTENRTFFFVVVAVVFVGKFSVELCRNVVENHVQYLALLDGHNIRQTTCHTSTIWGKHKDYITLPFRRYS